MKKTTSTKKLLKLVTLTSLLFAQAKMAYAEGPVLDPSVRPIVRAGDRDLDPGRIFRPIPLCQIDLAADRLDFRIIRRVSTYRGVVAITGQVKNVGRSTYQSRPGQQIVSLYEDSRLVASQTFTNLAPGATVPVSFTRNWDASSPAEGEFPPTYRLLVSFDPDLYIDGNVLNDDCSARNNQLTRSGTLINGLFH